MGAGGGAVVAAIAAAKARRRQEVLDAFRVAGATSAASATSLDRLALPDEADQFDELAQDGIVLAGPRAGTWYLSESAYVARRNARMPSRRMIAIIIVLVVIAAFVISTLMTGRAQ